MPGYIYKDTDFSGWIWNRARSVGSLGRAYNYPHQACCWQLLMRGASTAGS